MTIDFAAIGRTTEPFLRTWDSSDALLYALSVGAGQGDPSRELHFTTENSAGVEQRVIPSLVVPVVQSGLGRALSFGSYPRGALVHADQDLTLYRPLAVSGAVSVTARVASIEDKGSGALVRLETDAFDAVDGAPAFSTRMGYFVRGEGGFGGVRGTPTVPTWTEPEREPDLTVPVPTRADQALLYRLNGDRNPLHSDPTAAAAAGFPRPILHGLATYGIATRVLLTHVLGDDPSRLRSVSARFTSPVFPGDCLTLQVWGGTDTSQFRLLDKRGTPVLDRGAFAASPEPAMDRAGSIDSTQPLKEM